MQCVGSVTLSVERLYPKSLFHINEQVREQALADWHCKAGVFSFAAFVVG